MPLRATVHSCTEKKKKRFTGFCKLTRPIICAVHERQLRGMMTLRAKAPWQVGRLFMIQLAVQCHSAGFAHLMYYQSAGGAQANNCIVILMQMLHATCKVELTHTSTAMPSTPEPCS